jgi:putative membrane protein
MRINLNRTALYAALIALGVATGAAAQTSGQSAGTSASGATQADKAKAKDPAAAAPAQPTQGAAPSTSAATAKADKGAAPSTSAATAKADKGAGTGDKSAAKSSLASSERRFLENTAQHGMAEVELGKLAQDKAQDPKVKEFAKKMVDEHGKANDEVKRIAAAKNVTLPTEMAREHKRAMDKLSKKSGADFDRAYMDDMVDDHEKDVKEFRSMAKNAKDSDVKSFASSTLPTLEQHLQMAKSAESAIKSAGKTSTKSSSTAPAGGTTTSSASAPNAASSRTDTGTSASAGAMPSGAASAGKSDTAPTKGEKAAAPQK